MKQIKFRISTLGMLVLSSFSFANPPPDINRNQTGFFVGLGGSYNTIQVNSNMEGTLNAISGFPPNGVFSGTTGSYHNTQQKFAPEGETGYFRQFSDSNWLWGIKLLYQYSRTNILTPGTYIELTEPVDNTTNRVNFSGIQTKMSHELVVPAFIGHSLKNGFIYLGAGPSFFQIQHTLYNGSDTLSGYYIGDLGNLSNTKWLSGGAAQAGMAYYLCPTWFFNFNYTYATTGRYTLNNSASFAPITTNGLNTGSVSFNNSQRLVAQSFSVSINKVFS